MGAASRGYSLSSLVNVPTSLDSSMELFSLIMCFSSGANNKWHNWRSVLSKCLRGPTSLPTTGVSSQCLYQPSMATITRGETQRLDATSLAPPPPPTPVHSLVVWVSEKKERAAQEMTSCLRERPCAGRQWWPPRSRKQTLEWGFAQKFFQRAPKVLLQL